jgi:uncharacterized membrane protein
MAMLIAIGYPDQGTAEEARQTLQQFANDLDIQADQVATVSRDDAGHYHTTTTHGASAHGRAAWAGFWVVLFGFLFLFPVVSLVIGAGALFEHLDKNAIDKQFQQQVRDYLKPGTSALFLISAHMTEEKAITALERYHGTVIKTSLSDEDTAKLQEALNAEAPAGA